MSTTTTEKAKGRSVSQQVRDILVLKFRERDYGELLALLQKENPVALLQLQGAMDKLEEVR